MNQLKIYRVSDEYINYLILHYKGIMHNKSNKRPYIGIVIEINNFKYFAPLTSPKPKHLKIKNTLDFIKIKSGEYGAINLNNMIPVLDTELILYDIDEEEDISYKTLLQNQVLFIRSESDKIKAKATNLYDKVVVKKDKNFAGKCCDFKLLEAHAVLYKSAIRNSRNREIIKRYNGVKAVQLASEYGMRVKLYL